MRMGEKSIDTRLIILTGWRGEAFAIASPGRRGPADGAEGVTCSSWTNSAAGIRQPAGLGCRLQCIGSIGEQPVGYRCRPSEIPGCFYVVLIAGRENCSPFDS